MFLPPAKPNEPADDGASRTVVCSYAGRDALTPRSAKTTREVQSPDSCRSNTSSSGTPGRARITSGLYPPRTVTVIRCTPPASSAERARRGAKKNQPSPARAAAEAITTAMSATFMANSSHPSPATMPGYTPRGYRTKVSKRGTFRLPAAGRCGAGGLASGSGAHHPGDRIRGFADFHLRRVPALGDSLAQTDPGPGLAGAAPDTPVPAAI